MVSYPVALNGDNDPVPIADAETGSDYRCLLCDKRMIPRRGPEVSWHYAHYVAGECASTESPLHKYAKRLIVTAFESARRNHSVYIAEVICLRCSNVTYRSELNGDDLYALEEHHASPKLRPDVSFIKGIETVATVEVVVSNPVAPNTLTEYERMGIPAFIINPTWESVGNLWNGIRTTQGINVGDPCAQCESQRSAANRRNWVLAAMGGAVLAVLAIQSSRPRGKTRRWRY